ncbi:MAG TPA: oxidoreductase [Bacteroidales bacterium]|nr:oxidoreductase [Bacteroidales bacterium]
MRKINIPDQTGKIVIITGANSGIGFEAARQMAGMGAHVILSCRSIEKGMNALKMIKRKDPDCTVELMKLDLAGQSSIRGFSDEFKSRYKNLDILINNAGIMATPRRLTEDGFELQFGTNHLGHFSLTGLLLERLLKTPGSRIVTVTSVAHFKGKIDFNDINMERRYSRMGAYRRSKLANLLFAYELHRRLLASAHRTISVAVHPGITSTGILWLPVIIEQLKQLVLTSPVKGALSTIVGATAPGLRGGEYIGPGGYKQMIGYPKILESSKMSHDLKLASGLWKISEELTGVKFKL